ncbi:MAG: METTL5 family protein [Halobacteriaceae archaeon]
MGERELAIKLEEVSGFSDPALSLEQYQTSPWLAARVIHLATLNDDIDSRRVIDLGTGTGILAIGIAFQNPDCIVGLDIDFEALQQAQNNESLLNPPTNIEWVQANIEQIPLQLTSSTVVMNPPFGAQSGQEHADKVFLTQAASIADVSYSIHNSGSQQFLESFVEDHAGVITHMYQGEMTLPYQHEFHQAEAQTIQVLIIRTEWDQ